MSLQPDHHQARKLYENLVEHSQSGIYLIQDGKICFANPLIIRWTGYTKAELFSLNPSQLVHPEDRELVRRCAARMLRGHDTSPYEYRAIVKSGEVRWVLDTVAAINFQGKRATLGSCLDITAQKQAEDTLTNTNRVYAVLSGINQLITRVRDTDRLFREACRIAVEKGSFRMAWVGIVDEKTHAVKPAAHWGFEEGYLANIKATAADTPEGRGPTGTAIREGVHFVCNDVERDPAMLPWRAEALKRGYRSSSAFPLRMGSRVVGAFNIHAAEPGFFDEQRVRLLDELAADISFALDSFRREERRRRAEERLKTSLETLRSTFEGTVQAMAMTTEWRDPYTAGHQRRVAELSCALAREIGMSDEDIEGLRMAARIHDLGKIAVPAEILSKPGALTSPEFSLVKAHPQIGYDILKKIDFPWPMAQIVYQHHERMDGSGYPQGLSGAEILLEARILGVADVVEAMSSHRPYRPALGQERAKQELTLHKGSLYDPKVVGVCLKVLPGVRLEEADPHVG